MIVLAVVMLSLKSCPAICGLSHVTASISSYLDGSMMISLAYACSFGSTRLLDHIWLNSDPDAHEDKRWSVCQYLRANTHYYRFQFSKSLRTAVRRERLDIVKWVLRHFAGCTAGKEVVEQAACAGRLDILEYLLEYCRGGDKAQNEIMWGGDDMTNAIQGGHGAVAQWLYENTPGAHRNLDGVMKFAVRQGNMPLILWLLEVVYKCDRLLPPPSMNDAAIGGHMDIVLWIFEQGFDGSNDCALEGAAKIGRLDMIEWFVDHGITKGTRKALQAACSEGHLDIAQWILERCKVSYPHFAMNCAIQRGHLNIVKYLYDVGVTCEPSRMMLTAATYGHINVIKWLLERYEFRVFPTAHTFGSTQSSNCAMDRAASNGHITVLKFLHALAMKMQHTRNNRRPTCSEWALVSASSNGHIEVVKWLRIHYPHLNIPSTTTSMVARNGNLRMLQWFHHQDNVAWCTDAMDCAAEKGHLDVVKWIHLNRTEGCTTNAMDFAARNGHLNVVRWLHLNRQEGCTVNAVDFAVNREHFEVLLFLRAGRSEGCSPAAKIFARGHQERHILQWIEDEYPEVSLFGETSERAQGE